MSGIDDTDTAGITTSVTDKQVIIHSIAVTVTQCYHSFAFQQRIVADDVITGFNRNYFHFTGATFEQVVLNHRI